MKRIDDDPFELSRSATPPRKEGVYWVECLKGSESQKFLIYSAVAQGLEMHWRPKERKTVPCFKNHDLCPGGHSEKTKKWRCYVFAFSYKRRGPCFIQLTKDAFDSWMHQCREGVNLRGQTINVHRTEKDNGRLYVEVEAWRPDARKDLPVDQDCKLSVFDLWKFDPATVMRDAELASDMFNTGNGSLLR
jgi:hypothetical protein